MQAVTSGFACQLRPELVELVKWDGGMVSMIRSAAEAITASATVGVDRSTMFASARPPLMQPHARSGLVWRGRTEDSAIADSVTRFPLLQESIKPAETRAGIR